MEALLRFHSDKLGWLSPVEFIPILENNKKIRKVGLWVMEQAVLQNKKWNEKYKDIKVGFNVSYLQLYNGSLIEQLIQVVEKNGVNPNLITVELTESCNVEHPESLHSMFKKIIDKGFLVAIDDFGMEYSSMVLIRDLPITTVKIGHSFVSTIQGDQSRLERANLAIIKGIITICKELSYNLVVEGIENERVAELIKEMGVEYLQGYFYSKPVPADEVEKFFE